MPRGGGGQKKKLRISTCVVDSSGNVTVSGTEFVVMLNPSSVSRELGISYREPEALGRYFGEPKFNAYNPETAKFTIILDGTGVAGSTTPDVKTQIKQLEDTVYFYDGSKHEPNPVRVLWGSLMLFCRLTSMSLEYTLFKPSGEPLRAKVTLGFRRFMTVKEESRRANRSSPDLTHCVEVKSGDTLPLLCYRIYQDSAYYLEVARFNNISNFRDLKPGTRLYFPPLR